MIKEINKEELDKKCLWLIGKTLVDLGQTKPADEKIVLSESLSRILITKFNKLHWQAVVQAFEDGVLETDEFHLCNKTMFKWLATMKQKIYLGWDNLQKGDHYRIDPRMMELLNNQKLIE